MVTINAIIIHYDRYEYSILVFLARSQNAKRGNLLSFFLRPSCLSACNKSTTNGRILMKFDI